MDAHHASLTPLGGLWWTLPELRDNPIAFAAQRAVEQRRMDLETARVPDSKLNSQAGKPASTRV